MSRVPAVVCAILAGVSAGYGLDHEASVRPHAFAVSPALRDLPVSERFVPDTIASQSHAGGLFTNGFDISGVGDDNYAYPDSNGAVGATQYMQWTNARYAVFSKATGTPVAGPTPVTHLWSSLGGECATSVAGDGIINYDKMAQRWVVTHHTNSGVPYLQCVAVSTTSDATGSYYLYAFALTQQYPDYPQLGVWPDAYYLTTNLLNPTGFTNIAAQVCALDRTNMLIGNPNASAQCKQTATHSAFSVLQPADLDGSTAPPAGAPNYLLSIASNSLDLFTFHVDWVTPANTTLTYTGGVPVQPFTQACNGGFCIPQEGTTQVLDGVGDRLLHRLAYRNFGTYDVLLINHSVVAGSSVGVRWYEIRDPGTAPVSVYQQGTYAPDANYRWLGSIAEDHLGNIAIGYSVSSSTMYPAIRYTGRLSTDPLGTMEPEATIFSGSGAQTASGNDWGNASSMSIDPADECTFWYTNEYLTTTGTTWLTRIASFKFSACH